MSTITEYRQTEQTNFQLQNWLSLLNQISTFHIWVNEVFDHLWLFPPLNFP